MSGLLTRDQADLLTAYSTWQLAWMLTDPATGIAHAKSTHAGGGGAAAAWWYETTPRGIVGSRTAGIPVRQDVVVSWRLVQACADALPPLLRDSLAAARTRCQTELMRGVPPFAPSAPGGQAPWVRPDPDWYFAARRAEVEAVRACLDALSTEAGDCVPGQLDLFAELS